MCHGEQIGTTCSVSGPSRNATVDQIKDPPKPPRGRPGCRQASDAASPLSLSLSKPALLCQRTINPKSQATRRDDTPTPRGARLGNPERVPRAPRRRRAYRCRAARSPSPSRPDQQERGGTKASGVPSVPALDRESRSVGGSSGTSGAGRRGAEWPGRGASASASAT